jgi:hypothetical protein
LGRLERIREPIPAAMTTADNGRLVTISFLPVSSAPMVLLARTNVGFDRNNG